MTERTVTDSAGRVWTCGTESVGAGGDTSHQGRDVVLSCATASVKQPLLLTVSWKWETMADNGLARLISMASPVPRP